LECPASKMLEDRKFTKRIPEGKDAVGMKRKRLTSTAPHNFAREFWDIKILVIFDSF